jgi:16S rRNA (cytosine1402-N4)-methyltransferase
LNSANGSTSDHVPVLLDPVISGLNIRPNGCYVDGTFGRGGHSSELLKALGPDGRLLGIDRDPQAIAGVVKELSADERFKIVRDEIAHLKNIAIKAGLLGKVDGLLLDLGVSSPQLDEAERGFSFQTDGPLDMRMDPDSGTSAAEWISTASEREIRNVLFKYGEEKRAVRIARAIVESRAANAISRTLQLAEIVRGAVPKGPQRKHPATKTFQAIRIFINRELEQLDQALAATAELLAPAGRLCVISFHSLEDRRVKRFMRDASRESEQYRGMPNVPKEHQPPFRLIGKLVMATDEEIKQNPRARSARLRIAERT